MKNEERGQPLEWDQQLRDLGRAIEPMKRALRDLDQWLWEHCKCDGSLPLEVAESLQRLTDGLEATDCATRAAFERFCDNPNRKFIFGGPKLTEEEFGILYAMGVLRNTAYCLGVSEVTDYEAYSMLWYEDDHRRGFINPEEEPLPPGRFKVEIGILPESVRIESLRPGQEEFLRTRVPSLYARFTRD